MAEIKLTKNELREQQYRLAALDKYLPTLQLKKALLQIEVNEARAEIGRLEEDFQRSQKDVEHHSSLLTEKTTVDFTRAVHITKIHKRMENIAGVDVPYFEGVDFAPFDYNLFDTPAWTDSLIECLKHAAIARARTLVAQEKKRALEHELREVSIRVNLFEKILIPRAKGNIKKIRIFLGDQLLAAVSQAKVAKDKIEKRKEVDDLRREALHAH